MVAGRRFIAYRQDMSAAEKDAPVRSVDGADTGAEASSPEAPSSLSGPEPDHGGSEETSFRREFSHEGASRPEIGKSAQKKAPEKSAAPEEMASKKEAPHASVSGTADRHGMGGIAQELADVIREMEALLKPAGKKMAETSDGPREKDGVPQELSRSSRELLEFVRKETSGIGSGMEKSALAEANAAGVAQLLDALREKLEVMLQNAGDRASGGAVRDKAESKALRKDTRQIASELFGEGRDIRLSMRDREALQEILARMENMKERLARMGSAEPARIIRPVGRRDAGIDANAPDPGKVARGPHPSVSVRKKMDPAAPEPDSVVETVRAAAMISPDASLILARTSVPFSTFRAGSNRASLPSIVKELFPFLFTLSHRTINSSPIECLKPASRLSLSVSARCSRCWRACRSSLDSTRFIRP